MITRIEGELLAVNDGRVELSCPPHTYELLIPAGDTQRLSPRVGETVRFHTLHFLESQGQGASYVPRLVGFQTPDQRAFFELFTTVRGMGVRKALRALQLPFETVADAIAAKDTDVLVSLPEIGKRTAETIIAELHDRVNQFMELKPESRQPQTPEEKQRAELINDAVTVLTQLGESKVHARQLVERALAADPTLETPDAVMEAAFRLKELA